jgi:ribosome-associated protein
MPRILLTGAIIKTMPDPRDFPAIIKKEVRFESARASGPGGQNINKRNTKITGLWNFSVSKLISGEEKIRIADILKNKILSGRVLMVWSQKHRSQPDNKREVIKSMARLVQKALKVRASRISTKPSMAQKEKRITSKKKHSVTKKLRSRIEK